MTLLQSILLCVAMTVLRIRRMRLLLDSLEHPSSPLTISSFPQSIPAVRYVRPEAVRSLPPATLQDLAYRFSALGSVVPSRTGTNVHLRVSTHRQALEKLVPFYLHLGGSVSVSRRGRGGQNPSVSFYLRGAAAIEAARRLGDFPSRKQECLQLACRWPEGRGAQEEAVRSIRSNQKRRKENFFLHPEVKSWRDAVELVDKRGTISGSADNGPVRLFMGYPNQTLLLSFVEFLQSHIPSLPPTKFTIFPTARPWGRSFQLICHKNESVALILHSLLEHGLLLQREKALLALQRLSGRHTELTVHSNLSKYSRISRETVALSMLISTLRRQLNWRWRKKKSGMEARGVEELEEEVEKLVKLRSVRRREEKVDLLRAGIRDLLRKGAIRVEW